MSGFIAVVDPRLTAGAPLARRLARTMLDALGERAGMVRHVWVGDGAMLGVAHHAWEVDAGLAVRELCVTDDCVVVADAALYYRDELRRRLAGAGVRPAGGGAAALVAAAWRAWGTDLFARLEGDWAFALWNRWGRRLLCARDFAGRRPLVHAIAGDVHVAASTADAVLAHPDVPDDLDVRAVALAAAGLADAPETTGRAAVAVLPAAHAVELRAGDAPRVWRHWEPPTFEQGPALGFDDAVTALREALAAATRERLAPRGTTAVWLSGGWDSTAVFAAGQQARPGALAAVSMSYPVGDRGREDETIAEVAAHWAAPVHWASVEEVPLLGDAAADAARRDVPFAHVYEHWNRHLARRTVAAGARVALDGAGGDQFFQVSPVYLADLLAAGRVAEAVREWRARGLAPGGLRSFARWALLPHLPGAVLRAAGALRGRPLLAEHERALPPWIRAECASRYGIDAYRRAALRRRRGESRSALESRWYLETPYGPRALGAHAAAALGEGVEIRSPLYDARVIALAATRPRVERSSAGETKRLLRAAGRGLLPEGVLSPRRTRTGMTTSFFRRRLVAELPAFVADLRRRCVLADLGVADASAIVESADRYLREGGAELGVHLVLCIQTELWVRARLGVEAHPTITLMSERAEPRLAGVVA